MGSTSRARKVCRAGFFRVDFAAEYPLITLMPQFSPHQDAALRAIADWLKARPGKGGTPPIFRLFGYAGTGKTTLAKTIRFTA